MASRAAVGPGAQPSHPTLQMGLSACLPPTPQPHARDTSPGGTLASRLEASTSQEPKSHSKITKPQTPRTRGPVTTGDSTAGPGESRGDGVSGWGGDPPQDCSPCNRAEFKVLPSHGTSFIPGSDTGREERWSTPPSSLHPIFLVQSQLTPFFLRLLSLGHFLSLSEVGVSL